MASCFSCTVSPGHLRIQQTFSGSVIICTDMPGLVIARILSSSTFLCNRFSLSSNMTRSSAASPSTFWNYVSGCKQPLLFHAHESTAGESASSRLSNRKKSFNLIVHKTPFSHKHKTVICTIVPLAAPVPLPFLREPDPFQRGHVPVAQVRSPAQ